MLQKMILRPCPFCGYGRCAIQREAGEDGFRDRYYVLCDFREGGCGAVGGVRHSAEEAAESWNERRRVYRDG